MTTANTMDSGVLYEEAVTRYYPRFAAGARLEPSTPETRVAIQCLLEAWPPIAAMLKSPEDRNPDRLEAVGNMLKIIMAARIIHENLEAGSRIVEPKTKTPGTTPRG